MKSTNHETENRLAAFAARGGNPCGGLVVRRALFPTGMALAVVLGLMWALSAPSLAQDAGGDAMSTTVRTAGDVTTVDTVATATPAGTLTTTTTTVRSAAGANSSSSTTSFDGSAVAAATVTTTSTDITTSGAVSGGNTGVLVSRTGSGSVDLTNNADIDDVDYGVKATRSGVGFIDVVTNGEISAKKRGISVFHSGQEEMVFETRPGSFTEGRDVGIYAEHTGTGDLWGLMNGGTITSSGRGIFARHKGSGIVDVDTGRTTTVISTGGEAIFLQHDGNGSGGFDSDIGGTVRGHLAGVSIDDRGSGFVSLEINSNSLISASAANGDAVRVSSNRGSVYVDVSGSVSHDMGNAGKAISIIGSQQIYVNLIQGFSLNGAVVAMTHPDYSGPVGGYYLRLASPRRGFSSSADPVGVLDLDTEKFIGFTNFEKRGPATWWVTGTADEDEAFRGASVNNSGILRFSNVNFKMKKNTASAFHISGNRYYSSVLEIAGVNTLRGSLRNYGRLVFLPKDRRGNEDDATLTVSDDYSGPGGLVFNVGSAGWDEYKLTIGGDVSSALGRDVLIEAENENVLSSFAINSATYSPVLIEVEGNAHADDFEGDQTTSNGFRFVLEPYMPDASAADSVHRWRFRKETSSAVNLTLNVAGGVGNEEDLGSPNTTSSRGAGGQPAGNFRSGVRAYTGGVWAQQQSSRTLLEPGATVGSRSSTQGDRVHFGFDLPATSLTGGDVVVGASVRQGVSNSDVSFPSGKGVIGTESHATVLTALWRSPGSFYADGHARYIRFSSNLLANGLSLVQDNKGSVIGASTEVGYRFAVPLSEVDLHVTPQMGLVWSRVGFDDFVDPHGGLVSLEDGDLVKGRLGLSWDGEWRDARGSGHVHGGVNLRTALDGRTAVNVSGVSFVGRREGLSVDGRLGVSYEWDEGYAAYGEAVASRHDNVEEVRANLGMRINF